MPITPFLNGRRFDPETTRVMGVALEMVRISLQLTNRDDALEAKVAEKLIELAAAGEQNPDLLCDRVLFEIGKQQVNGADPSEYHLIDLATGLSCGGRIYAATLRMSAAAFRGESSQRHGVQHQASGQ